MALFPGFQKSIDEISRIGGIGGGWILQVHKYFPETIRSDVDHVAVKLAVNYEPHGDDIDIVFFFKFRWQATGSVSNDLYRRDSEPPSGKG